MTSNASTACRALFDCRWPIKCHRTSPLINATFVIPSCTRFSPRLQAPASTACCTVAESNVLETAMRVISSALRPARSAARAICSRTRTSRSRICSAIARESYQRLSDGDKQTDIGPTAPSDKYVEKSFDLLFKYDDRQLARERVRDKIETVLDEWRIAP